MSGVHAKSNSLVIENCSGLLAAALLDRISNGKLVYFEMDTGCKDGGLNRIRNILWESN
jgi:hypothetical protein